MDQEQRITDVGDAGELGARDGQRVAQQRFTDVVDAGELGARDGERVARTPRSGR